MSRLVIICIILFSLLFICSCKKDTNPIAPIETPEWLENYIEEIEDDPSYRYGVIYLYQWREKYYYDVFSPYRSCIVCEVYSYDGVLVSWDNESAGDYSNNKIEIKIVWQWKKNN